MPYPPYIHLNMKHAPHHLRCLGVKKKEATPAEGRRELRKGGRMPCLNELRLKCLKSWCCQEAGQNSCVSSLSTRPLQSRHAMPPYFLSHWQLAHHLLWLPVPWLSAPTRHQVGACCVASDILSLLVVAAAIGSKAPKPSAMTTLSEFIRSRPHLFSYDTNNWIVRKLKSGA